jgi:hypothetical protein
VSGAIVVVLSVSFAALVFTGPLERHLQAGIGLSLFGSVIVVVILAATSSFPVTIGSVQDTTGDPGDRGRRSRGGSAGGAGLPGRGAGDSAHLCAHGRVPPGPGEPQAWEPGQVRALPGHRRLPGRHRSAPAQGRRRHRVRCSPVARDSRRARGAGRRGAMAAGPGPGCGSAGRAATVAAAAGAPWGSGTRGCALLRDPPGSPALRSQKREPRDGCWAPTRRERCGDRGAGRPSATPPGVRSWLRPEGWPPSSWSG